MTKYLVLYKADTTAQEQMSSGSPDEVKASMAAWMDWQQRAGDALVDMGSPLAAVGDGADASIGGYSIVQADSDEALATLLGDHPHQQVGTLETHQFLDMSGM